MRALYAFPEREVELTFAPREETERREEAIARLLETIGFPEAWVSDESTLSDFLDDEEHKEELKRAILRTYGVLLRDADLETPLWRLVEKLEG